MTTKVSKSGLVKLIRNSEGVFAVTFTKNNGKERTIIGIKGEQFMTDQGYINMTTLGGKRKTINPRSVIALLIENKVYKVK